jgi:hypothetical protein
MPLTISVATQSAIAVVTTRIRIFTYRSLHETLCA